MELIDKNILIAKFMGAAIEQWYPVSEVYKQTGLHAVFQKEDGYPGNEKHHSVALLKYHSSWEWLMSVVEKIESLDHGRFGFTMDPHGVEVILYKEDETRIVEIVRDDMQPRKDLLYDAVCAFMEWYYNNI